MTDFMSAVRIERVAFRTSRLLDFVGRRELTAQIGHDPALWPIVIVKELVENALDAAEEAEIAPVITVTVSTQPGTAAILVRDNGPGLSPETVAGILDYSVRVSSREAYVAPTRGAQGNALKTIIAMAYALTGECGETLIESQGVVHRIVFRADSVRQEPRIQHHTEPPTVVKNGTTVTVRWPATACVLLADARSRFLQIARGYAVLNPHLSLEVQWNGEVQVQLPASDTTWCKWRACDPTSAHWYDVPRLARYAAAHVARDQDHQRPGRTVRDFISEFRGLSGSGKQKLVLEESGLARLPLAELFDDGVVEQHRFAALLGAMQKHTRPVKPRDLGVIGSDHLQQFCNIGGADDATFRYRAITGETGDEIPFVVEAAFAAAPQSDQSRRLILGVNFAPALANPFRSVTRYDALEFQLYKQRCGPYSPVIVTLNLACARVDHQDRGKSAIVPELAITEAIEAAIETVTRDWAKQCKAMEREDDRAERAWDKEQKTAAKPQRSQNTIVGSGVLYREIEAAAVAGGHSICDLTVLSPQNDPYRLDTTEGHELGLWFADLLERFVEPHKRVHLRGLFYLIVVAGNIEKPDGQVFTNTLDNWVWLQARAAKAARWLRYVGFDRISDERNAPPQVFLPKGPPAAGDGGLDPGLPIWLPDLAAMLPCLSAIAPRGQQPYRIVMIGEKSSLTEVLAPIAEEVEGELLLPTGEATDTMIAEMAARAAADGRPTQVLYFSDFDPAGWQMPISVSRKLQALRTLHYPNLRIQVHRVALTLDQVRQFNLPSTPLKATEKRAVQWRETMQHEQTEIDALAALRSDDLRKIALDAIAPFYDFSLAARCEAARQAWLAEAEAKIAGHPALATVHKRIATGYAEVEAAVDALRTLQADAHTELAIELSIERALIPAPAAQLEIATPAPLISTEHDFAAASRRLIAEKKYQSEEGLNDE